MNDPLILLSKTDAEREFDRLVQQARSRAIRMLGLSRKPSGRILDLLRQEGYSPDVVEQVMAELRTDGYLDDERLARRQIANRSGSRSESIARLTQRLLQLGLDPAAVGCAMASAPDDRMAASQALSGRFDLEQLDLTDRAARLKVQRFLMSRGFSGDIIRETLSRLLKNEDL
jgi:regulatory protein